MLASHNRLFWYYPEIDNVTILHEGEGVHYGVFPGELAPNGDLKTVWNVIRPHNWHPKTSEEHLVQLDANTGREVSRVRLQSRFTHDAVRRGDRVYVANTEGGEVQELAYPSMQRLRSMKLFSLKQHVNTLAPLGEDHVWVVLHNLGKSDAVKVDLAARRPAVSATLKAVGLKAHGLVAWGRYFVMLDSENAALVIVDPETSEVHRRWQAPEHESSPKFLKGLCVVDEVAYFGVNVWGKRESRDSKDHNAELAAVSLKDGSLLWRRPVPSHGLLNIVAAPQLGEASTYRAMAAPQRTPAGSSTTVSAAGAGSGAAGAGSGAAGAGLDLAGAASDVAEVARVLAATSQQHGAIKSGSGAGKGTGASSGEGGSIGPEEQGQGGDAAAAAGGIDDPRVRAAHAKLLAMGYKPKVAGHWASGLPFLDLATKDTPRAHDAGLSLPLMQVDISKLRAKVLAMPDSMWSRERQRKENAAIDGRADNMAKFKPGVEALYMVFSDQSTKNVYRFPYYNYFKDEIEPIVEQIVGKTDARKVVRMQFARMKPGTMIKAHKDMGGYAKFAHRIHLPIVTHPNVTFEVCPQADEERVKGRRYQNDPEGMAVGCLELPMADGMVFELNNRVTHQVRNNSPLKRVQLVVDVAEAPRSPRTLKPGAVCNYVNAVMVCPPETIAEG